MMTIRNFACFLLMLFIAVSCERDDSNSEDYSDQITQIKTGYIFPGLFIMNQHEVNFNFNFDGQKRLVKKTGGFLPLGSYVGFNASFTPQIFTTLIYGANNKVLVEDFSTLSDFTPLKNTKIFTLNSQKKIELKEIPDSHPYRFRKQNFIYQNGYLDEIKTSYPDLPYDPTDPRDFLWTQSEKFFYDSSGNLIRTEFYNQNNGVNTEYKIVRFFENYDNSKNPFKDFVLLDEYFYRSLSKNNFRTYKVVNYETGSPSTSQQDWIFNYDSNGNIIVN